MAWYEEAIFYHIYPLGMLNAPKENHYDRIEHRLKELDDWIPHIKAIGCNAIYIGPLFESVGHGYETTDYKKLDSRLGDNDDLKHFVKECHKAGIRVIFDGVFNHTGRDFFAFKDIKENRENSQYRDWYCNVNFCGNNEYNDGFSYDNWGGYNLLVKLNQRNGAVRDYISDVVRFWVSEFDVDGIRLDAADVLDFDFMKMLRYVADTVKEDFWLMGEVIHGDYTRWVNENTLHSVTNYTLHKGLYSGHNDHNYFEIAHTVKRLNDMAGSRPGGLRLYNFTDNHDVERIITKLNNKANYYPVHILEYTLPGVPSIYYGSEFAIEGRKEKYSDDSLRPHLSYKDYANAVKENPHTAFIAALSNARHACPALSYGDYKEVLLTNRQYAFTRNTQDSTALIAVNNDENQACIHISGVRDGEYVGALLGKRLTVSSGSAAIEIPANYGEIYIPESEYKMPEFKVISEVKPDMTKPADDKETEATKPADDKEAETVKQDAGNETGAVKQDAGNETGAVKSDAGSETDCGKFAGIASRTDYDSMTIEELQAAILAKMAANGPVTEDMKRTVYENVYPDSLRNWVRSFR